MSGHAGQYNAGRSSIIISNCSAFLSFVHFASGVHVTMRAVVQRVLGSSVVVDHIPISSIGHGLLVLLGVAQEDNDQDLEYLVAKVAELRIFEDDQAKMNLSVSEIGGEVLVVSQFTLLADCRKGRRPSFIGAAPPAQANELYERFCERLRARGLSVQQGRFQADMKVNLINDGPVTIMLDSRKLF